MLGTTNVIVAALSLTLLSTNQVNVPQSTLPVDVTELVTMFSDLCIKSFASDQALIVAITGKGGTLMPPTEIERYFHGDPGKGWYLKTPMALYAVTLEYPPYHTCAVRRMTPEGADKGISTLAALIRDYAMTIGGKTVLIPTTRSQLPDGVTVTSFGTGVLNAAAKPSDAFGIILSNFHGGVPPPWVADGTPGVGVEVRLSRMIIGR